MDDANDLDGIELEGDPDEWDPFEDDEWLEEANREARWDAIYGGGRY